MFDMWKIDYSLLFLQLLSGIDVKEEDNDPNNIAGKLLVLFQKTLFVHGIGPKG